VSNAIKDGKCRSASEKYGATDRFVAMGCYPTIDYIPNIAAKAKSGRNNSTIMALIPVG
jgi:hypothetical protein